MKNDPIILAKWCQQLFGGGLMLGGVDKLAQIGPFLIGAAGNFLRGHQLS